MVQHRLPLLLALQLHPAQHPPLRRRRQLHHDREHRVHVGVPGGLLLPVGAAVGGGLLSIWMGMYLDWVFRSLCFAVRFVRGRWLERTVI